MTIRSGLVVLIRCFVVLSLFQSLLWGISLSGIRNPDFVVTAGLLIVVVLGIATALVLLYIFAGAAVDIMTPKSNELFAETAIRADDLQAIAFSTLGVYILYVALRDTISVLTLLQHAPTVDFSVSNFVVMPAASWIVGFYLLVGAPAVRRWIGRLRHAGQIAE